MEEEGNLHRTVFPLKIRSDFCKDLKSISSRKNSICKGKEARENMILSRGAGSLVEEYDREEEC